MMGRPRLKRKDALHYKRCGTWQDPGCPVCNHFVGNMPLVGIGGVSLGTGDRCKVLGLKAGRAYTVRRGYACARWDNTKCMRAWYGSFRRRYMRRTRKADAS